MSLKDLLSSISDKLQAAVDQLKVLADKSRDDEPKMQVTINNPPQNLESGPQNPPAPKNSLPEILLLILLFLVAAYLYWHSGEIRNSLEAEKIEKEEQEQRIRNLEFRIDSLANRTPKDTVTRISYLPAPNRPPVPRSYIEIHTGTPAPSIDSNWTQVQSILTELADSVNSQHRDLQISINELIKTQDKSVGSHDWLAIRLALDNLLQRVKSQKTRKQRKAIIGENDIRYLRRLTDSLKQDQ